MIGINEIIISVMAPLLKSFKDCIASVFGGVLNGRIENDINRFAFATGTFKSVRMPITFQVSNLA